LWQPSGSIYIRKEIYEKKDSLLYFSSLKVLKREGAIHPPGRRLGQFADVPPIRKDRAFPEGGEKEE